MRLRRPAVRLLTVVALPLLAAFGLAACAVDEAAGGDDGRLDAVVTMNIIGDFVAGVGGEHVAVTSLVGVGGDPHTYEPVPGDSAAVADADIVFRNGLGLEPWFDAILAGSGREAVVVSDGLEPVLTEGEVDPHLWMSPPLATAYVDNIRDALAAADPDNAEDYRSNAAELKRQLAALDEEIADQIATIPAGQGKLVTSHDAYSYFADRYGLEVVGTVVGVTTEEEPSAATVRQLIDDIRAEGVPTVFFETTVNPSVIERIARDAGVEVGEPLYGDSLGEPGSGADTYVGMMRANTRAIVEGLGGTYTGG